MTTPDGEMEEREVIVLDKGHERHEDTGLSIEEGKALLKTLQQQIVTAQTEAFCASRPAFGASGPWGRRAVRTDR